MWSANLLSNGSIMKQGIISAFDIQARKKMARGLIASFAGMLVMACSGCGGGGGGAASSQAAVQVAPQPNPIAIDYEGDSLVTGVQYMGPGYSGPDSRGNGYRTTANNEPQVVQNLIGSQYVTVENHGAPGSRAIDSLDGIQPYYSVPFATRLSTESGRIVIANYAVNDSARGNLTTSQYADDLTQWIADVRAVGKTPVLEEPNPVCDPSFPNLDAFVSMMRVVAQQNNVPLIEQYDYIKSLPNWQSMLTDCIHPNDALYSIKAQRASESLSPIIKKLGAN